MGDERAAEVLARLEAARTRMRDAGAALEAAVSVLTERQAEHRDAMAALEALFPECEAIVGPLTR